MDQLRGFVAVGRRMSVTLAAQDLCLTQSAVSRQINLLEDTLGVKLLNRGHRSLSFTPEGERLFRAADAAVQQLQDTLGEVIGRDERRPVTVTASVGVASLWLLPRLGRFQARHPGIDVRVATANNVVDLRGEGVDIAIRYCMESAAPPRARRLFGEAVVPVAHPALGLAGRALGEVIREQVLIEFDEPRRPWLRWADRLEAMGLAGARPKGVVHFNQYDQVVHAAIDKQGIALGRLALVGPMLADGRLVALSAHDQQPIDELAYWLLLADEQPRPEVGAVVEWITLEAAATAADPERLGEPLRG